MSVLMLAGVAGLAGYVATRAQVSLDARNIKKNTVNGWQDSPESGNGINPMGAALRKEMRKREKKAQSMALPLSTLDEFMVRINEFDTNSKIKRRRVPTIPGLTRSQPFTSPLPNNPNSVAQ